MKNTKPENRVRNFFAAILIAGGFSLVSSAPAFALVFTDTVLFNSGNGTTITDNNSNNSPASITPFNFWLHDITDNIGGNLIGDILISDATLLVTYSGITTASTSGELWNLIGLGNLLAASSTSLPFGPTPLADLAADGLYTVNLNELSNGSDSFVLNSAVLSGNYTLRNGNPDPPDNVTPEPLSGILLAIGLGSASLLRKRSQ